MSKETRKQRGKTKDEVVFPLAETLNELPSGYYDFISKIKNQIVKQVVKSRLSANKHMIVLYWHIGKAILQKQDEEGWGAKIIDRMSYDLKEEFPDMKGFSPRNLKYMKKFAESWNDFEIVQRTVALIPWRSNITLLDKLKEPDLRLWYAQKVLQNGMGKDMLVFQIESQLHLREGKMQLIILNLHYRTIIPILCSNHLKTHISLIF